MCFFVMETMRAEWAKMKARQDCWEEEYQLVQGRDVMYCCIFGMKDGLVEGSGRETCRTRPALAEGVCAYAWRQSSLMTALAASSVRKWIGALTSEQISVSWASKYVVWSRCVVSGDDESPESSVTHEAMIHSEVQNEVDNDSEQLYVDGGEEEEEEDDTRFDRYDLYD